MLFPLRPRSVLGMAIGVLVLATAVGPARGATVDACGTISGAAVWNAANVYLVGNCATVVDDGATLDIQAGTVVKFTTVRSLLLVHGTLRALGSSGAPVTFTSARDDSRGGDTDGDGPSAGAAGDWAGIRFAAGSAGTLSHVDIAYGGSGAFDHAGTYNQALVESWSSAVTLAHVTLRDGNRHGLYTFGASVGVSFGQVRNQREYGLLYDGVDGAVPLTVADTTFSGNGSQAGWISFRDLPGSIAFERCSASGGRNAIRISGRLPQGSLRWSNGGDLPLLVQGGAFVAAPAALHLEAGTVAKFADVRDMLVIEGELQALGSSTAPVVFSSGADDGHGGDTNGDGVASSAAKGQWAGVRFAAGSVATLEHVLAAWGGSGAFDYAGRYNAAILEGFSSDLALRHVAVHGSGLRGLYAEGASVALSDGEITANATYGIEYRGPDPNAPLVVRDTSFSGNGAQAGWLHFVDQPASVTFEGNQSTGPRNAIRVDGRLAAGSLRWANGDELPLLVEGGLALGPAAALRLEAGSVMKFADVRDVLLVEGLVEALGAPGAEVAFTGGADDSRGGDSNGNGPSTAAAGQWAGLRFLAGSQGELSHFFLGYGGSGAFDYFGHYNRALIESDSSAVRLDHCSLHASGLDGLYASGASVAVSFCSITDNEVAGLHYAGLDPLVALTVTDNVFGGSSGTASRIELSRNPPQIIFARNTGTGGGFSGGFRMSGEIDADTLWDNSGSLPLVVEGGVGVATDATLTLAPGTVVKFAGVRDVLQVAGSLQAVGTEEAPIAFTGLADDAHGGDTNGDGPSAAAPGQWGGLRFLEGSSGRLAHAFIGYGGAGAFDYRGRYTTALLESASSDVSLENATLRASNLDGLRAYGASVAVRATRASANAGYGLRWDGIDPETPLAVEDCSFEGNGAQGAWLQIGGAGALAIRGNLGEGARSGFRVSGSLASGSLTWDCPEQTLVVDGGLAIGGNAALGLAPGAVVKFAGVRDVLQSSGFVDAVGTPQAPILFTSLADDSRGGDTNGDGASVGARGQWGSVRIVAGRVALGHATVAHGGSGAFDYFGRYSVAMLELDGGEVSFSHGTIAASNLAGVHVAGARATVSHTAIVDHGGAAVRNVAAATVDARRNWWGDASGPHHPVLNPTGQGGTVSDGVRFDPWLERYAWLEPTTALLHGVEALSWRAFDTDPGELAVDVTANDGAATLVFGLAQPGSGTLAWDTDAAADGPYELRAAFRDGDGRALAEAVLPVVVNNDADIEWHGGRVAGTEIWGAARLHVVEADVVVGAGARLVLEPGAVVKFLPGTRLIIEDGGEVEAEATAADPIVLTAVGDDAAGGDTNLDGDDSRPRPGDWDGVQIEEGGEFERTEFVEVRYSQAAHAGALSGDETWLGSLLHRVDADVVVPAGMTLTIEAGAIVKLGTRLGIVLQPGGRLVAQGTAAQPIVFTSLRDDSAGGDSNGDGDTTAPAPGDWR